MAAQLSRERTIGINLGAAEAALFELPSRPGQMEEYDDWSEDWIEVMARFEWVADLAEQGMLDREQQASYEQVLRRLREHLPLIRQLDLPVPEKVLEAIRVAA